MVERTKMAQKGALILLIAVIVSCFAAEDPNENLVITRASRELDLQSHIAKQSVSFTLQNEGETPATTFLHTVDKLLVENLVFIEAETKSTGDRAKLSVEKTSIKARPELTVYRIKLASPLNSGDTTSIVVRTIFAEAIKPHPKVITQADKQLVQFTGNAYILTPYRCKTQNTDITLTSSVIESYSKVSPVNTNGAVVSYGPYTDVAPLSHSKIVLHYENNGPFMVVESIERVIQVSHWGVIQVEEHIHVLHSGAKLSGSFSRFDYQRNPQSGLSSIRSFTSLLPAAAKDVYYRDEIGNISTSHLREDDEYTEILLRPRFPLFGGWQTRYTIGYNLPSFEYLFRRGNSYLLNMRLVDHVYDDQIVNHLVVKVILPEGSKNIEFSAPYPVEQKDNQLHFTYLDVVGRPVVVVEASDLIDEHIQDFELTYTFEAYVLVMEPLLVVGSFFLFFLMIIGIVRLDFTITKDPALLAQQQAAVIKDLVIRACDSRLNIVKKLDSAIATFKKSKDGQSFKSTSQTLFDRYVALGRDMETQQSQLRENDSEAAAKVSTLQKKSNEIGDVLTKRKNMAEKLVSGSTGESQYVKDDNAMQKRLQALQDEVEAIVQTL